MLEAVAARTTAHYLFVHEALGVATGVAEVCTGLPGLHGAFRRLCKGLPAEPLRELPQGGGDVGSLLPHQAYGCRFPMRPHHQFHLDVSCQVLTQHLPCLRSWSGER